ncbi:protein kinase domain-containing protein [Streptomyces boninensis]|uniref:protein kinase domain-containing protein n=1 Tax=Streptomyces boninensis TaxID=2039455 RepID=UPI003B227291
MTDHRPDPSAPYTPAAGDTALRQTGATPLQRDDPPRIGPYVPLGVLGSGGMGRVYLARPADDGPGLAAVKVIRPEYAENPDFRRRFEREAAVHARVTTPHAPRLLGNGFDDSLLWMATEYVAGLDLAQAVRECGVLSAAGVWRLVGALGRALGDLSAAGVVHRDLKPSNVILSLDGAYVIDFGISQAADSSAMTTTGSRVGTPAYMAPEYLREARCDTRSDVFSLAGTVIYAATGYAPFGDGTGVDVMHRVAFEEPKAEVMAELAALDPGLAALLAGCLAKSPEVRPTPAGLGEAAAAAGERGAEPWQEPLAGMLRERRTGGAVLAGASAQQTGHLRAPTQRQAGFGPAAPGGYGASSTPPGSYGPASPVPGPYGAGAPVPPFAAAPQAAAAEDTGTRRARERRRGPWLAAVAGVAVCAVAAGAFFMTRSDTDTGGNAAASKSPTTSAGASAGRDAEQPLPSLPPKDKNKDTASPSPSQDDADKNATSGAAAGSDGSSGAQDSEGTTTGEGSGSGGGDDGSDPTPSPTKPPTPPWISQCTYYSGTELTDYGDSGKRVVQAQCMLTRRGYSVGSAGVDGEFGKDTVAAVKKFQNAKGLDDDGQVGPLTWSALRGKS